MASTPEAMKPEKIARNRTLDKQVQLLMKREQLSEDDVAALCDKVRYTWARWATALGALRLPRAKRVCAVHTTPS